MSSVNPESNEFERFVAEANDEARLQESLEVTVNRFRLFLSERGIVFDIDDILSNPDMPDASLFDRDEVHALVAQNQFNVRNLATIRVLSDMLAEYGETDPDMKKQTQATAIASGLSAPWPELIDSEFTGEPLDEHDDKLIDAYIATKALSAIGSEVEYNAYVDKLNSYLSDRGVTELSLEEEKALQQLVVYLTILGVRSNTRLRGNFIEEARLLVIEQGLDSDLWNGLISHFFEESE